ncbi:unnamed protein product [Rodentolepis nana]|uniref:DUF5727 domain-containing protein n=1 Tax=Rodentolepis nana TaxID=102285 RepID=A0A0R3T3C6_RODNA|nr:unnamed protein product [Rodentolepis nana]
MFLNRLVLIIYLFFEYAEGQEVYGSRIVTTSRGPVGPLKFTMLDVPRGQVRYQSGMQRSFELDSNNNCITFGTTIGSPCVFNKGSSTAAFSFDNVAQYKYIEITDGTYEYTVYFADDCLFPTPKPTVTSLTAHLTSDKTSLISSVSIKLNMGSGNLVTYKWGTADSSVALTLDWENSGTPPEIYECQGKNS